MKNKFIRGEGDLISRYNPEKTKPVAERIVELIVTEKMSYAEACEALDIAGEEIKHLQMVNLTTSEAKVIPDIKINVDQTNIEKLHAGIEATNHYRLGHR